MRLWSVAFSGLGAGLGALGIAIGSASAGPPDGSPALEPPIEVEAAAPGSVGVVSGRDVAILQDGDLPARAPVAGPPHEAFQDAGPRRDPVRVEKAPPPPIVERPHGERPSPDAAWVEGYWDWDPGLRDFAWIPGTWRIAPPGRFWVNGSWRRDDRGWTRIPGFWSARRTDRADWRKDGPPSDRPAEEPVAAPGPGYFYLAGHYAPDGDGVAWRPGFWAKAQSGWDWTPARWVRRADAWDYREGHWERNPDAVPAQAAPVDDAARLASIDRARDVPDAALPPSDVPPATGLDAAAPISAAAPAPTPAPVPVPVPAAAVAPEAPYVVQRPAFAAAPSIVALADQLAGQADQFARTIAGNAGIINGSGGFIADGQRVRDAALQVRQAAAAGDPNQLAWALRNLDAASQGLSARLWQVSGYLLRAGRVGPFSGQALQIGNTNAQIQNLAR